VVEPPPPLIPSPPRSLATEAMDMRGSGLSVEVVGEMSPWWVGVGTRSSLAGEEELAVREGAVEGAGGWITTLAVVVVLDGGGTTAPAPAPVPAPVPATSKLQRTPAWLQREHEGLMRSQRRLKCRQRSHVLTSRMCGIATGGVGVGVGVCVCVCV
jgi:hypothetical protein